MKKKITLLFASCLCCVLFANAQNKIVFTDLKVHHELLDKKFKSYKILEINDGLQRIADGQQIVIALDRDYRFVLKENKMFSPKSMLTLKAENGTSRKTFDDIGFDGQYFANSDISPQNQLVFSMFENRYSFYIKTAIEEFYIEPLKNIDPSGAPNRYVYYEVKDIIAERSFGCGFKENGSLKKPIAETGKSITTGGCKTVGIDFLIDYSFYETYGNTPAAINRVFEILNLSQANYTIANGLLDDVSFKVWEFCIVTCDGCNLWPSTLEIGENYESFYYSFYYVFFNDPQDRLKIYFQNQGGTPNPDGGIVAGLASPFTCGISGVTAVKNYADDTDLTRQILSHEMGHNLGCAHTVGYIMNPVTNYATSWAPESIDTINNTVNTLSCIADCNALPCESERVNGLAVNTDITTQQISISWISEPGMSYKMRLYNLSTNQYTDYTTLAYPANSITYPVSQTYCNDKYRFMIVPVCGTDEGVAESLLFNVTQGVAAPTLTNWTGFTDYFYGILHPYTNLCRFKMYYCRLTAIDGGTAPFFQWKVNGENVGTNSSELSIWTLQNNDVVSCELTSNDPCVASPYASFSTTVTVVGPTELAIGIDDISNTTICAGESLTLTQTVAINTNYTENNFPLILESYFNNVPIDYSIIGGLQGSRIFTFTPWESGTFHCVVNLMPNQDGMYESCYTNTSAISMPVYITVLPQPCGLGTADFDVLGMAVYPNPVTDILTIEAKQPIDEIKIYTVLGQELMRDNVKADKATFDFSAFAKGTYFLKIRTGDKIENRKVIKE